MIRKKKDGATKELKSAKKSQKAKDSSLVETLEEKRSPASFYGIDFNETDKNLSPDQLKEWTGIYASYRSKSPLSGRVMGVDSHRLSFINPDTNKKETKEILCLVVMHFRVKVLIPQTEIWHESTEQYPEFVIRNMVGAPVEYVIVNVDRDGDCAVASRKLALGYRRNRFLKENNKVGSIVSCNVLTVGAKRIIAECGGFDMVLTPRELSYTAMADLRNDYRPGQKLKARILKIESLPQKLEVSVKEVNPNPFYGADQRHPVGARRQGIISGTYGGGLFCRLIDDTNIMCLYHPGLFTEEFYIGDEVLLIVTQYDYERKMIYGKILAKW